MKKYILFFGIFSFLFLSNLKSLLAQDFYFTPKCQEAYNCFLSMKIQEGKQLLANEIISNKNNLLPFVLVNYEDFISLTFNENPVEYKLKKDLLEKRIKIINTGNEKSPYYLFSKALLYFHWSIIKIKYADYWNATWDFRKSYLLFKENKKKFPNFTYNNIYLGLQESVISSIPNGYKWASSILGLKGNMKNGLALLKKEVYNNDINFKNEAIFYFIYLKNYLENDTDGANKLIETLKLDTKNNQLFVFMASNLAINNKKAQIAENYLVNRTKSAAYMPFPMLDYELADAKLKRLEYHAAILNYLKFIKESKGNFYIKDSYYNIAIAYYLQNDLKNANQYLEKTKNLGKKESDADKQAYKNAIKGKFPSKNLLKAKLLNDGGYNTEALQILSSLPQNELTNEAEKLEFIYRKARVYDDLNQDKVALEYYFQTIQQGKQSTEYFAARAYLQAGFIYEKMGNKTKALEMYNNLLDLGEHEFKNSLDQRAKSSINRLK